MKKLFYYSIIFLSTCSGLFSQYFQKDALSAGANIGVLNFGAMYGARGELGLTENIGLGLDFGYYQFDEDFSLPFGQIDNDINFPDVMKLKYKAFAFQATGSYHFMPESKFDPYARIGLGYIKYDCSLSINDSENDSNHLAFSSAYPSILFGSIEAGMNYHINDVLSFRTSIGYPFIFNTGFDISFNRPKLTDKQLTERAEIESKNTNKNNYAIYFGYYLGVNVASKITIPNGMLFMPAATFPDAGFSCYVPFAKKSSVGFLLNVGYSQLAYSTYPHKESNDSNTVRETYGFLSFQPSLYLGGFVIGCRVGIPKFAKAQNKLDQNQFIIVNKLDTNGIDSFQYRSSANPDALNTQIDLVLGGSITLVESDAGILKLNIMASYALKELYKDYKNYYYSYPSEIETTYDYDNKPIYNNKYSAPDSKYNPTPICLSLGISYLFRIGF